MLASLMGSLSIGSILLSGPRVIAQTDNFPDVPDNHWAYGIMYQARNLGMLPEDKRSLTYSGRPYNRYEIAVFGHEITEHLVHEAKIQELRCQDQSPRSDSSPYS